MAHGGARTGAGRKPKSELYARQITAAEKKLADRLPVLVDNMIYLADGGYQRVEEKHERQRRLDEKGSPVKGDDGEFIYDLVLVERKVSYADKDRAANQYLIDRVMGKPTERHEHDIDSEIAELMARLTPIREEEAS